MFGARILGLAFGFVATVWAARCLGPKNLGISGMVQNVVLQATMLVGAITPTVLIRQYKSLNNDEDRNRLVRITNGFRLLMSMVLCVVAAMILAFHGVPEIYHRVGWMFIPNLLLVSIQPSWLFQAVEKQQFQSTIAVFQPALTAVIYITFFKPGMSAGADLLAITTVALVLLIVYWIAIYKLTPLTGSFFSFEGLDEAWELLLKSRWLFVSALAIYVYTILEQPLIGWLYSVEELGKYRTAVRVTEGLNGTFVIISTILFPRFIEWRKQGEAILWRKQLQLTLIFSIGGGAAAILGFILIPYFYPFIFGRDFIQAGLPCAILVSSKILVIVNSVFGGGLLTDHKFDKAFSLIVIITAILSLSLNLILIPRFGMFGAAWMNLLSEVFILVAFIWMTFRRHRTVMMLVN